MSPELMTNNLWAINQDHRSTLESRNGALSKLDLKAPWKARREYEKGYQLLMRKDFQSAVDHLTTATSVYANFVAAHNALGSAYLGLAQNDQARAEFVAAWRVFLSKRTEADSQVWRDQRDWTARKYALWDAGKKLEPPNYGPGKPAHRFMKCPCGEVFDMHGSAEVLTHVPHISAAEARGTNRPAMA